METTRNSPTTTLSPEQLADLDLILTDAFLSLGIHLLTGKVNPETWNARWEIDPGRGGVIAFIEHGRCNR